MIAFCTHCSDDWFFDGGCSKLLSTAKHFHPDIPFFVFGSFELNLLAKKYPGLTWDTLNPIVSKEVAQDFDKVVHFDADSIILGSLNEILEFDADVLTVRNNNDFNTASRYTDPPITVNNCAPENYMNAGLIASKNRLFWDDWISCNKFAHSYPYKEQDTLNILLQSGKYNHKCLDPKDSSNHYGISCHYGEKSFWDSSRDIMYKNGKFVLKDKVIKVYHQAGGHQHFPKLQLRTLFNEETAKEIERISSRPVAYHKRTIYV